MKKPGRLRSAGAVGTVLIGILSACVTKPAGDPGTSVTVLVDFSKSFAPLSRMDRNALTAVSASIVEMAAREWSPPVKITWRRIDSESSQGSNLCGPLEFDQKLIKSENELDRITLHEKLTECADQVIKTSQQPTEQADFT